MERRGPRICGPYAERDGHRFVLFDGEGGRCSFKAGTIEAAQRLAEEALRRLQTEKGALTIEKAIVQYEAHLRDAKGGKPRAVATTCIRLRSFFAAAAPPADRAAELDRPLTSLTPRRAEALYVALSGRPCRSCGTVSPLGAAACKRCGGGELGEPRVKVDTHRNMLAEARTFVRWCAAGPRHWLARDPLAEVKGVGRRRHGKPQLRLDDARRWIERAFALADRGDEGAVGALMTVGMALSGEEITKRVVRDVDDKGRLLHITDGKTEARRQPVPIHPDLQPYLLRACRSKLPDAPLFAAARTGGFHWRDWPTEQVRRICKLAGVPVVTSHGMRGLRATLDVLEGRSLREAGERLRHADGGVSAERSYVDGAALEQARQERAMRLLRGR